jgi:hypothetical protein
MYAVTIAVGESTAVKGAILEMKGRQRTHPYIFTRNSQKKMEKSIVWLTRISCLYIVLHPNIF